MAPTAKPEVGDLVEIFRGAYQHWAVYVGDGYVIHLAPPTEQASVGSFNLMMSVTCDKGLVKKEELQKVAGEDRWKVNNILDSKNEPHSSKDIVQRAESMVGQLLPYSVLERNCEHFATDLRYGKPKSRQVRRAVEATVVGGVAALAVLGAVVAAAVTLGCSRERESRR
ncbi:phospholipase A and acyltransferase 3-like [Engraulis encrasicolus]|uniref:phospholipase A and acyltransferase 3-like n=1 Tax=Engraulis encrasicolus TaxID=184585 RepID=UPI002FD2ADA5